MKNRNIEHTAGVTPPTRSLTNFHSGLPLNPGCPVGPLSSHTSCQEAFPATLGKKGQFQEINCELLVILIGPILKVDHTSHALSFNFSYETEEGGKGRGESIPHILYYFKRTMTYTRNKSTFFPQQTLALTVILVDSNRPN